MIDLASIDLIRAAPHIALHRGKTFVVKIGGEPLAQRVHRRAFAQQIAAVHALGSRIVLVHGGGPQTDSVQRSLGEEPRLIGGKRVTTPLALRALCMATAGELHGELLADLAAAGVPAAGLAGASAGLLVAKKRPPVQTEEGTVMAAVLEYVMDESFSSRRNAILAEFRASDDVRQLFDRGVRERDAVMPPTDLPCSPNPDVRLAGGRTTC